MEKYDIMEKSRDSCCAGKTYLANSPEFSEGSKKRVEVPHLVKKVGAGFQQGFTISRTKGS